MRISRRETTLALATVAVAVFGGTAMLAKPKIQMWKELLQEQAAVRDLIEQDRRMLATRDDWTNRLAVLSKALPEHPPDQKMDVHWLSVIDSLADRHNVRIAKIESGAETQMGHIYELPIECKDWEAGLDSMVHFLFDLQAAGGMLDVRRLMVKPKEKGILRGNFSLYCAYTKGKKPGNLPKMSSQPGT